ncbi:hypothetical protein ACET3Z_013287 [Daucus carota]
MGVEERPTLSVKFSNVPKTSTAQEIADFFESRIGKASVFACEIFSDHKNWKARDSGRVQFETPEHKITALALYQQGQLVFKKHNICLSGSFDDVVVRPVEVSNRVEDGVLSCGIMSGSERMWVLEKWGSVRAWVMPERMSCEFWLDCGGVGYKLEVLFGDVLEVSKCCLNGAAEPNAVLLTLKYAPRVYKKVLGPHVDTRFSSDRYHVCKEDFDFLWIRETDFSSVKSIGQSCAFCCEFVKGASGLDAFSQLPFYKNEFTKLVLKESEEFHTSSELNPLVRCPQNSNLSYEVLFQLNALVHNHKLSLAAVNPDLVELLSSLDKVKALAILQKVHKLQYMCFDPMHFIKDQLEVQKNNGKNLQSTSLSKSANPNVMSCHRVLITPSKIYCLGPELESSSYVVKNFSSYASDFLRVTFVDEDLGKLHPHTVSASTQKGIFAKPCRTSIYHRVLSVLREGIVIGAKRFQFLAFSASQLRSNSVWMFASNEHVRAEDIRDWMGCFNKIRSVSKCAARMGQLFSSSTQIEEVLPREVEIIPDVEVVSDGVEYCFSDGIGKISYTFAKEVAKKCGLSYTPSAFQIRFGGYKGVLAVDTKSSHKLSLRGSMHKFDSDNRMLNITSWSESMPCYLNREIISLLSTLGVEDHSFVALQDVQIRVLQKMLTEKEAALDILESMGKSDSNRILAKMLVKGYNPNEEPYLSMMLRSHYELQVSDLRSRCRILVPKGRILIGCLDESGILDYGQVYIRIAMTNQELKSGEQTFFHKVDETTSVLIGRVVVTKNPCLHPGDIRVLEAVYDESLMKNGLTNCLVFPQKGERPHPNECSGGDLDGDLYFISWDEKLIPPRTVAPMDYTGRRPRLMDHDVSLEEIQRFFVDYLINDSLGTISTAHLVHADLDQDKALSETCLYLANLHSMAVDFAKTGAPAEMPRALKPRMFPDFMERWEKQCYTSQGALGKLYRATVESTEREKFGPAYPNNFQDCYDHDLEVNGFESFISIAKGHKEMYLDKLVSLMKYYEAKNEVEILSGNLQRHSSYLLRDNRRYGETKDRIMISIKNLHKEAKGWFDSSCAEQEKQKLASAWYHVTYHPTHCQESIKCLGFPWIVGDILLDIKSVNSRTL